MQDVERVEDDGVLRMGAAMLKRLEGRTAVLVDGHDLTVEDNAFRFQPPARGFHLWIREWLFVARTDIRTCPSCFVTSAR